MSRGGGWSADEGGDGSSIGCCCCGVPAEAKTFGLDMTEMSGGRREG